MNDRRRLFLDLARATRDLIASDEVGRAWSEPSALPLFSVKGLAGHLWRGVGSVAVYLDRDEPEGAPISAAEYYASATEDPEQTGSEPDLDSALHRAIRQRGEEAAAAGRDALLEEADELIASLEKRLSREPADRKLRVFKDLVLRLDDYLATRIVELVVHIDDLVLSVGAATPSLAPEAIRTATDTLIEVARHQHGELAVLRALARRERDTARALRVL